LRRRRDPFADARALATAARAPAAGRHRGDAGAAGHLHQRGLTRVRRRRARVRIAALPGPLQVPAHPARDALAGVAQRVAHAGRDHHLVAGTEAEHAAAHLEDQSTVEDQDALVLVVHEIGPDAARRIDPQVAAVALFPPFTLYALARNPCRPLAH